MQTTRRMNTRSCRSFCGMVSVLHLRTNLGEVSMTGHEAPVMLLILVSTGVSWLMPLVSRAVPFVSLPYSTSTPPSASAAIASKYL